MKYLVKKIGNKHVYQVALKLWQFLHGTYPYFVARANLYLRAEFSKGFNQRILQRMLSDRSERATLFSDKWLARQYVDDRVGTEYLTKVFGVYEKFPSIRPENLPRNFVVKTNHSSGGVILVWDGIVESTLPPGGGEPNWSGHVVHPDELVWQDLETLVDKWMARSFYWTPGKLPEWAYKNIPRRVFFEELLVDPSGVLVQDFKLFMFDGKCELIQHDIARFSVHLRDLYSPDWQRLNVWYAHDNSASATKRPEQLETMLRVAEDLSKGIDFVRVDLFVSKSGVKFGELTNYPDSGLMDLKPRSFNVWLGEKWVTKANSDGA